MNTCGDVTVKCPTCGADVGYACFTRTQRTRRHAHKERERAHSAIRADERRKREDAKRIEQMEHDIRERGAETRRQYTRNMYGSGPC